MIDWTTSLDSSSESPEVLARFVHNPKYLRYATVHIAFTAGAGSGYFVGVLSNMLATLFAGSGIESLQGIPVCEEVAG
jgi:hypothetical protein